MADYEFYCYNPEDKTILGIFESRIENYWCAIKYIITPYKECVEDDEKLYSFEKYKTAEEVYKKHFISSDDMICEKFIFDMAERLKYYYEDSYLYDNY